MLPQFTRLADNDMEEIMLYTMREWGVAQARKYKDTIDRSIKKIAENPNHPSSRAKDDLLPGCRSIAVGKHWILYRGRGNVLEILRVLHQSMDVERHRLI